MCTSYLTAKTTVFFSDKTKPSVPTSNTNSTPAPAPTSITVTSPTTPANQVTTPTSPTKKVTALPSKCDRPFLFYLAFVALFLYIKWILLRNIFAPKCYYRTKCASSIWRLNVINHYNTHSVSCKTLSSLVICVFRSSNVQFFQFLFLENVLHAFITKSLLPSAG